MSSSSVCDNNDDESSRAGFLVSVLENESEGLRCVKLSKLPGLLESERSRAESLSEKNRENAALLQRQTHSYLSVSQRRVESAPCLMSESNLIKLSL